MDVEMYANSRLDAAVICQTNSSSLDNAQHLGIHWSDSYDCSISINQLCVQIQELPVSSFALVNTLNIRKGYCLGVKTGS